MHTGKNETKGSTSEKNKESGHKTRMEFWLGTSGAV